MAVARQGLVNSRNKAFYVILLTKVKLSCLLSSSHRKLLECCLLPESILLPALLYLPRRNQCWHFFLLQDVNPSGRVSGKSGEHGLHQTGAEVWVSVFCQHGSGHSDHRDISRRWTKKTRKHCSPNGRKACSRAPYSMCLPSREVG